MRKTLLVLLLFISINIYSQSNAGVNLNPSNEIKFMTDEEMKAARNNNSKALDLPPLPGSIAKEEGSTLEFLLKEDAEKIKLQEYSDVKFKEAYKENENGTYSPKNNTISTSDESFEENHVSNEFDYQSNSLNDESLITVIMVFVIIVFLLLSEFLGRAKHIGRWWTFFLLLAGFIPGLIAVISSPSARKNPTKGGKGHAIWAWVCLVFGILNTISFFHSNGKAGQFFFLFLILSFYLFALSKGDVINRNPKFYF